jgi:cullin 3
MSGQPEVRFEDVSQKVRSEAMKVMKIIEEGFKTDGSVIGVASKMEIYTAIYNACPLTNDTAKWNEIGNLFVKLLEEYITVVTKSCEQKTDEPRALLAHVCKKYEDFCVYLKVLKDFFLYIVRGNETIQVLQRLLEASSVGQATDKKLSPRDQLTACGIQVLAQSEFRKFLVVAVTPATLKVLDERRLQHNSRTLPAAGRGEEGTRATVAVGDEDFELIKKAVKLYKDLGNQIFDEMEKQLLLQCSEFYKQHSIGWLESFGCYDFFRKSALARQYESEAGNIVHSNAEASVAAMLFEFDIASTKEHQEQVLAKTTGIVCLLQAYSEGYQPSFSKENSCQEDGVVAPLKIIFSMLQHVDPEDRGKRKEKVTGLDGTKHGLVPLQKALSAFIPKELSTVCDALEIPPAVEGGPPAKPKPLEYIKQVIVLKEKYDFLVLSAFNDDRRFHKAVQTCFEEYINKDKGRVAEFLSLYLHSVMKKSVKGNEDYDATISQCMNILTLTRDKDMFFEYYKKHFAMRLLGARDNLNKDSELIFLAMLKERVGVHQAHHLEKMFKDIEISTDMLDAFKREMKHKAWPPGPPLIDLAETVVVTVGHWPKGYTAQGAQPRELLPTCEAFKEFYVKQHSGRRLNWDMSKGRAEVEFRSYKLEVSTYQMCILLAVQEQRQMGVKQLQESLNLDDRTMKRHLHPLCTKDKRKNAFNELLSHDKDTNTVQVNGSFKSKTKKPSFMPEGAGPADDKAAQQDNADIQEKRKFEMRAALVRVMKSEKTVTSQQCMSKAIAQLSQRFQPQPRDMKQQIERLIEQEFFKRDDSDRNILVYLA